MKMLSASRCRDDCEARSRVFRLLEGPEDATVLGTEFHQRDRRSSFQRLLHGTSAITLVEAFTTLYCVEEPRLITRHLSSEQAFVFLTSHTQCQLLSDRSRYCNENNHLRSTYRYRGIHGRYFVSNLN